MEHDVSRRNLLLAILAFAVVAGAILVIVVVRQGAGPGAAPAGGDSDDLSGALEAPAAVIPSTNPYENVPSVNPVEQANPFNELKTNPFSR